MAGLNIANERLKVDENEHAVFLSGNGPLVDVFEGALARDEVEAAKKTGEKISKNQALSNARVFIQNIHHFRDDALSTNSPPIEKVVIFDEAQRAWTRKQTASFMQRKRNVPDFSLYEPEFLNWKLWIGILTGHNYMFDWGGQELISGEDGLPEWLQCNKNKIPAVGSRCIK